MYKGKEMTTQRHWIVGFALALVLFLGATGFVSDARAAQYNVSLQVPSGTLQYQNGELIATVTDSEGRPVSGIPVDLRVGPDWEKYVAVSPLPTTAQNGRARIVFRSDMPGVIYITAQAGDTTTTTYITISGSGS